MELTDIFLCTLLGVIVLPIGLLTVLICADELYYSRLRTIKTYERTN